MSMSMSSFTPQLYRNASGAEVWRIRDRDDTIVAENISSDHDMTAILTEMRDAARADGLPETDLALALPSMTGQDAARAILLAAADSDYDEVPGLITALSALLADADEAGRLIIEAHARSPLAITRPATT